MPIKKDETGKRWVEMELLLPGTPEQVWQAVATGPGNASWFVKGEIEARVGGMFRLDFGGGATTAGEVTTWDPPRRFGYVERDWEPGAPPVATEITISGRAGNTCVMRMVHSLFSTSDEWDDQIEGFERGWPGFFAVLRVYLAHFAGTSASSFMTMTQTNGDALTVWRKLSEGLGVLGADVGELRAALAGPERWSGVVERAYQDEHQRWLLLRVSQPSNGALLLGTYNKRATSQEAAGENVNVNVCRYFYGESSERLSADAQVRWGEWLEREFKNQ